MGSWVVYSILAILAWGSWGILLKLAYSSGGWREVYFVSAVASFILALIVFSATKGRLTPEKYMLYAFGAGLLGGLGYVFLVKALETGKASVVIPLTGIYPALTAILATLLLGEKLTPTQALGVVLAVVAVYLLSS